MAKWEEAMFGPSNNNITDRSPSPPPSPKDKLLPTAAVHEVDGFTLPDAELDAVGQWGEDNTFSFHVQ